MKCRRRLALAALSCVAAGCAATIWEPLERPLAVSPERQPEYSIEVPQDWMRLKQRRGILVTREGPEVQFIQVMHRNLRSAFPNTQRQARTDLPPAELAAMLLADTLAEPGLLEAEVLESGPASWNGMGEGFKVHMRYRLDRGPRYEVLHYGFVDGTGMYVLSYRAPSQHYFERHLATFERALATFQIARVAPP